MMEQNEKTQLTGMQWVDVQFGYPGTGKGITLLDHLNLHIAPGEFVCLLGKTGCGKTTLMGLAGGLLQPTQGHILLDGHPVALGDPRIGFVFQEYALHPWRTVAGNVELPLRARGQGKAERQYRVKQVLERVQLWSHQGKYPFQLSGGMKQRTAIARVLATDARYLLMDEPFGALDAYTRSQMQEFLLNVWQADRKTILLVTHSVEEALLLSSRILLLLPDPIGQTELRSIPVHLPYPRDAGDPQLQRLRKELMGMIK